MLRSLRNLSSLAYHVNGQIINKTFPVLIRLSHNKNNAKNPVVNDEGKKEQFSGDIPIGHLKIRFSRSPGPGGQNVNKVNTKVDVRFHVLTADWIPLWIRHKLQEKEVNRINKEGELVIQSNRFRSQKKNLEDSVGKINEILKDVSYIPKETSQEKKHKISELMKMYDKQRLIEKKIRAQKKRERSRNDY